MSSLLTVPEVMATLKLGRSTIYRLFSEGELAWVQVGAKRRVTAAEIDRFIAAHTTAGIA